MSFILFIIALAGTIALHFFVGTIIGKPNWRRWLFIEQLCWLVTVILGLWVAGVFKLKL